MAKKRNAGDYHGKDGLGDVPHDDPPKLDLIQDKKAIHAIIQTVNRNPGEVQYEYTIINLVLSQWCLINLDKPNIWTWL